jgi:hypothetical protein
MKKSYLKSFYEIKLKNVSSIIDNINLIKHNLILNNIIIHNINLINKIFI